MKTKLGVVLLVAAGLLVVLTLFRPRTESLRTVAVNAAQPSMPTRAEPTPKSREPASPGAYKETPPAAALAPIAEISAPVQSSTNKLQRLADIREEFHTLASGDAKTALHAAKQLTDETEREAALMALLTEWTHGDIGAPRQRAGLIAEYGLEAGLGMALAKNPELATLWAYELTDGQARVSLLQATAVAMLDSDPAAAFAMSDQVAATDRQKFVNAVYAGWAGKDTEAALQWANQTSDPAEKDSALQAIRSMAPVGIGAMMAMKDGYPIIAQTVPGGPAESSGQLHQGDRIVGLGVDNGFVDARSLSLQQIVQMVRGAQGTTLQLQVIPADAPADSTPRTISITRDQVKFKRKS